MRESGIAPNPRLQPRAPSSPAQSPSRTFMVPFSTNQTQAHNFMYPSVTKYSPAHRSQAPASLVYGPLLAKAVTASSSQPFMYPFSTKYWPASACLPLVLHVCAPYSGILDKRASKIKSMKSQRTCATNGKRPAFNRKNPASKQIAISTENKMLTIRNPAIYDLRFTIYVPVDQKQTKIRKPARTLGPLGASEWHSRFAGCIAQCLAILR